MITHGSLFSGIGGFDLAAAKLGWTNVFQCENNPFCRKVLEYHFKDSILYGDIKETDFTGHAGAVDVISGGFPCQPFSLAGKRKGRTDDRFLWPEMLRCIREVRPSWVVAENVYGLLSQSDGMVFEQVCSDMENEGYEVQPFIIPACAVDAPHRRDRVWIVAHRSDAGFESMQKRKDGIYGFETFANSVRIGLQKLFCGKSEEFITNRIPHFRSFPSQSPVYRGDDGLPVRLDSITFPKWRDETIKAYGNAIVWPVAYRIFEIIDELEKK